MHRLSTKVALVTGASRGMGAAHAREIVAEGGRVVLGVREPDADNVQTLLGALGDAAVAARLEVTDYGSWERAVDVALSTFGALNVLVNNAAIVNFGSLERYTLEDWDEIVATNLTGPLMGIKACVPALVEHAPSSIINVASATAFAGIAELHGYTAAKWGLRGLTRSVALELAPRNVRCNCICPGTVATDMNAGLDVSGMNAMNRKGDVREVSTLVVHLASDESTFMTGADILVDGGEVAGRPALDTV